MDAIAELRHRDRGSPAPAGNGQTISGELEQSNVDMATEFTNMIEAERGYQANSSVISTADQMMQTLIQMAVALKTQARTAHPERRGGNRGMPPLLSWMWPPHQATLRDRGTADDLAARLGHQPSSSI